jgi:hypothetical protein
VINLVFPSKTRIRIGGGRERNVDNELCGRIDKEVETTENYVATELMKNQVH